MVFETLPNETKTMNLARASELVDIITVNGGHLAKKPSFYMFFKLESHILGNLGGALGLPTTSIFQLPDRPPRFSVRDLLWDRFLINFGVELRLIGPKAHWINVEGVHAQSLVSNTPYTVLEDFGVQVPPQIDPKSTKNRFRNGSASNEIKVGGFDAQKWFRHRLTDRWRCALGPFLDHFGATFGCLKSVRKLIGSTSRVYMRKV